MDGSTEQSGGKTAWLSHVKKTMKANKGKSLKAVLKMAAKTYKAKKGGALKPLPLSESSPATGGRRRRGSRKTRRTSRKH